MIYNLESKDAKKKDLAFSVIVNSKYLPCLGTFLVNLDLVNIKYDAVHVLYDDIGSEEIIAIRRIWTNVYFHNFSKIQFEDYYEVDINSKPYQFFSKRFSFLSYLKYRSLELLRYYKKVIFCDLDAIFLSNDFSTLCEIKGLAWKQSFSVSFGFEKFYRDNNDACISFKDCDEFSDCNGDEDTPNGGFIYFSDDVDYESSLQYGDAFIKKYIVFFYAMIDELVFAYLVRKLNISRTLLDTKRYNSFPWEIGLNPVYVHFAGEMIKPWDNMVIQRTFPLWKVCYLSYINNYGGTKLAHFTDFNPIGELLYSCNYFENFWHNLLKGFRLNPNLLIPFDYQQFYLIFPYKDCLYFEWKTDIFDPLNIVFGFWIKSNILSQSSSIKDFCSNLNKLNEKMFKILSNEEGIYIYSDKISKEHIQLMFDYFVDAIISNNSPIYLL